MVRILCETNLTIHDHDTNVNLLRRKKKHVSHSKVYLRSNGQIDIVKF